MDKKLNCFFCNRQIDESKLGHFNIFKTILYPIERKASDLIADLLDINVIESKVHSDLVCRKCFTLINEFAGLDSRAAEIRTDLLSNYNSTKAFLAKNHKKTDPPDADDTNEDETVEYIEKEDEEENEVEDEAEEDSAEDKSQIILDAEKLNQLVSEASGNKLKNLVFRNEDGSIERPKLLVVKEGTYEELNWEDVLEDSNEEKEDPADEDYKPDSETEEDHTENVVASEDNMHVCKLCPEGGSNTPFSVETVNLNLMSLHLRHEHGVRLYLCDVCGEGFKKRSLLITHLNGHTHDGPSKMTCDVCNRVFSNWRLFRVHKRQHNSNNKAYNCDICGKYYSSRSLLDDHRNGHHGVRPYKCTTCTKSFTSKYTYRAHLKTHQPRERSFQCPNCPKSFMSQPNLLQHLKTHSDTKDHICNTCGKGFATLRSLEVHSVVHSGVKPFVCLLCGKAFARKAEIKDHERTHTGERPFTCDICGAGFSQRSNLQSHKRVTHFNDRRYQCDSCGKAFKRRRLLDYHVRAVHTGERPYTCKTCDAAFVYPEHYKKHIRIHTGIKPFKCEVCEKAFNSRDNRNAHRFVHSDKKPYECLVCGVGFMRKPLLYNHMQMAGHMNDTIVVNQPRLDKEELSNSTTGDVDGGEQEDYELAIVDENGLTNLITGKKVYVSGGREHVIIGGEGGNIQTVINDQGNKQIINEDGTFVDLDGNTISIEQWDNESPMVTHINERGQLVNEDGQVITEDGQALIVDETMETESNQENEKGVEYVQIQVAENQETWLNVKQEPE